MHRLRPATFCPIRDHTVQSVRTEEWSGLGLANDLGVTLEKPSAQAFFQTLDRSTDS